MVLSITDVLNVWNQAGVFSYVIPVLLVFAVVYALLEKTKILGENKAVYVLISISIGLLSIQFDIVPQFFAVIFPRFGVGLSIFFALVIILGFFYARKGEPSGAIKWIGWVVGIGVAVWAISDWSYYGTGTTGFGYSIGIWLQENFWAILIIIAVIGLIASVVKYKESSS